MIIDESEQDRLHRIVYNVFGPEYLLNQRHVSLGALLLFERYLSIDVRYVAIVLSEQDLTLYSPKPLVQIVLRFSCQDVLPVLIFYFDAVLLSFIGSLLN